VKSKVISKDCSIYYPYCDVSNNIPSFTHWILLCPKFKENKQKFIQFIDEIFINFSAIVHEKNFKNS